MTLDLGIHQCDPPRTPSAASRPPEGTRPQHPNGALLATEAGFGPALPRNDADWTDHCVADEVQSMVAKTLQDAEAPPT